jgi:hypothetical protein
MTNLEKFNRGIDEATFLTDLQKNEIKLAATRLAGSEFQRGFTSCEEITFKTLNLLR